MEPRVTDKNEEQIQDTCCVRLASLGKCINIRMISCNVIVPLALKETEDDHREKKEEKFILKADLSIITHCFSSFLLFPLLLTTGEGKHEGGVDGNT